LPRRELAAEPAFPVDQERFTSQVHWEALRSGSAEMKEGSGLQRASFDSFWFSQIFFREILSKPLHFPKPLNTWPFCVKIDHSIP
jgi:hypothetical protein